MLPLAARSLFKAALLPTALMLGGCSSASSILPDWDTFKAPDMHVFASRSVSSVVKEPTLRPITAEDMVDGEGRCAAGFPVADPAVDPSGTQTTQVPLVPSGIALEMTECDVVKRAGQPEKVDIGTNERGERKVTLTYLRGERPGIYYFAAGRLSAMERSPEPPAPPKPAKKPKPKKSKVS